MEVTSGMSRERSAMNALQNHVIQHSPSPKEQMAGNVARHYVNQLYSEVDGEETQNKTKEITNIKENIIESTINKEEINKEEEDDNSNILNKSIAEIQSIINNISFFPQNKGECVNNSDITSMSVDSKAKDKSNSKSKTVINKCGTVPNQTQKLQLPPLVESQ